MIQGTSCIRTYHHTGANLPVRRFVRGWGHIWYLFAFVVLFCSVFLPLVIFCSYRRLSEPRKAEFYGLL